MPGYVSWRNTEPVPQLLRCGIEVRKHRRRGRMARFVTASVAAESPVHIAGVLQALPLLTGSEMELREGRSR
jgi:hypothetical protein